MDVGVWLRSLGLGQYEATFRDNEIDGAVLPKLTVDDLKDLGVAVVGHRRKIMSAIEELNAESVARTDAMKALPPQAALPVSGSPSGAERRPITVMFCDLVGSTSLAAMLDAEDWRNLVNAYLDEASKAVTGFGGHVLKKLGDGLMALFGYPQAQENDAERAVRAALAIQRALVDLNARNAHSGAPQLSARIGIETGPVVVDATGEVFGDAPNVAARVQAAADPGSVLITGSVQRQVAGLFVVEEKGVHELKGVAQPLSLYRVIRASGAGRRGGGKALTQFVGREEELGLLARRWERARVGEGQHVLVVGEPGLGKSRLIEEFHVRLAETPHTWVEWSASQLLQNTPLHPIAEWGRQRFGLDAPAEQRLGDLEDTLRLIGLDPAEHAPLLAPLVDIPLPPGRAAHFPPEELRRRQLAAMTAWVLAGARSQPVVVAFEDLHWADPTSLDLLRAFADRGAQAPLFLITTTRPEFRPHWSVRSHDSVISLSPLDRVQIAKMVAELSAHHALPRDIVDGVSERTGGVPLFVEEVTRLLLERGEQGGAQAIPPTLQQSLAARLDRLGAARETAQIGAVLGRGFSYALLQSVAGLDEGALQSALERLAQADILFIEGDGPQANYRFKHALIQDAAYDSLLKSRRQALHRRAAEALRDESERAAAEPEVIAHHFTQAGFDDLAIEWWGKAGDQALRRSAFQEAIAHLGKAIAMADKTGAASTAAESQRLKLQTSLGQAIMHSRGYGSEESKTAFARARRLVAGVGDASERFDAYYGLFIGSLLRGELSLAQETVESFLREAENEGRMTEAVVARRCMGLARLHQGDLIGAQTHLAEALRIYDPERDRDAKFRFGSDSGASTAIYLALASWAMGSVEQARALSEEALARADETAHAPTRANVYQSISLCQMFRRDPENVKRTASILVDLGREHGMSLYVAWGEVLSNWARAWLGDCKAEVPELRSALAACVDEGNKLHAPLFQGGLAELEAEGDDADGGLQRIDAALALASETGEHWTDALLHRIRGEILLKRDPANLTPAEEAFLAAITIAQAQKARSFELQAALSLAKLYQSTGRPAEAHAILAPALVGFSPTPEFPEIREALALFEALVQTDEAKADAAGRHRLTQLHVARGNALIAVRGAAAPETTEAFARARALAHGDDAAPGRLAAHYGLWVGSSLRGELPSMRMHAAAFLADVAGRPDSAEAGVAHRVQGMTFYFAGEFVESVRELELGLSLFQPGRDDDLAFRFGQDTGAAAMVNLAVALWPLGEVDRAIWLIDRMRARIAALTHIGTRAFAIAYAAFIELMRGDHERAAPHIFEIARLAREHDLPMIRAFAVFLQRWAASCSGAPADGIQDMRHGVDLLREQNVVWHDGMLKIALAGAEARAGAPDRAIAILDEALATVDRLGYRAFEAELHRARGEILLKLDPVNPAPAEEAFLTAIAVAKQQATRSFELRAALSLAKLHQSTDRPADAHAVLAPALEGFAPTLEMPEIAEAVGVVEDHCRRFLPAPARVGTADLTANDHVAALLEESVRPKKRIAACPSG